MIKAKKILAFTALALSCSMSAKAADPLKIGFIGSLTGPLSTLSTDMKDGFNLALKHKDGKLGGAETIVVYGDDQANPDAGKQVYERMSKSENVDVITGMAFTNVMLAVAPSAFNDKIFFINSNAGPKELAGASCNYYYFNPTWHTSALSEAAGRFASQKGYKKMFVVAPNYQAGREHLDGFDKEYTGEIAGRAYNKIGQLDFSVEIGQIRAANPDAVFFALWGPMAINFIKQFHQAGLNKKLTWLLLASLLMQIFCPHWAKPPLVSTTPVSGVLTLQTRPIKSSSKISRKNTNDPPRSTRHRATMLPCCWMPPCVIVKATTKTTRCFMTRLWQPSLIPYAVNSGSLPTRTRPRTSTCVRS